MAGFLIIGGIMPQLGSFSAGDPQTQQAVQEAIARRQGGQQPVPQLSQTGQGQPTVTPPPPAQQAIPGGQSPQGATVPESPTIANPEAELILKALSQRLGSISAVEKAQVIPPKQPSPQQAPVGGGGFDVKKKYQMSLG